MCKSNHLQLHRTRTFIDFLVAHYVICIVFFLFSIIHLSVKEIPISSAEDSDRVLKCKQLCQVKTQKTKTEERLEVVFISIDMERKHITFHCYSWIPLHATIQFIPLKCSPGLSVRTMGPQRGIARDGNFKSCYLKTEQYVNLCSVNMLRFGLSNTFVK